MRLLVDTDAFCKLALADLLTEAVALLGARIENCGRLPALLHMLRRGSLPRFYGQENCDRWIRIAERMPVVPAPNGGWLELVAPVSAVDPGEAILLSVAAEAGLPLMSGDIRALRAVKEIEGFPDALAGRIVVLEALLLALLEDLGPEAIIRKVESLRAFDTVVRVCFSPDCATPEEALSSYLRERERELAPLVLWDPLRDR